VNKIETMLRLQQELNDNTNGKGWESGITQNGKVIDWRRCIWLEAAELVESYPWKHWKNIDAKADYDNIKIEAVDIWHFVMSEALRLYAIDDLGDISDLTKAITSTGAYGDFVAGVRPVTESYYDEVREVEQMVGLLFGEASVERWTAQFYRVALIAGLDLDTLYELYIGKNILNRFRQDHGYKDGTYIKIWNGQEDNAVMQEILASNEVITPEELYDRLVVHYSAI